MGSFNILPNNDFGNRKSVDLLVMKISPPISRPTLSLWTCAIDADLGSCSLTVFVWVPESTLSYSYTVVDVTDLTGVEVEGGSEIDTSGEDNAVFWPSSGSSSESLSVSPKSLLKDFLRAAGVSGGVLSFFLVELVTRELVTFSKGKGTSLDGMAYVSFPGLGERTAALAPSCLFFFFLMEWGSVSWALFFTWPGKYGWSLKPVAIPSCKV